MKFYIAGPMRGYPEFNFPAFDEAAERLRSMGHEVFSPAESDRDQGFDPSVPQEITQDFLRDCIRRDLNAVTEAEAVFLLDGWEESSGARLERQLADFLGLPTYVREGLFIVKEDQDLYLQPVL